MSLKTYKENFNEEVTNFIISKLKESGMSKGQIRMQIIDDKNILFEPKEDIVDETSVVMSTGFGIMFATKKTF